MELRTIRETIVVEGKDDETRLKQLFDVDIIKTNGTHLGQKTLMLIAEAQKNNGVIIFTDPDHPGEEIRHKINATVPGCKNAFLTSKSRRGKLVGVEHATDQQIIEALENMVVFVDNSVTVTSQDMMELGLIGNKDSEKKRFLIEDFYHLGHGSAKTLLKRLNHKQITTEELEKLLEENGTD